MHSSWVIEESLRVNLTTTLGKITPRRDYSSLGLFRHVIFYTDIGYVPNQTILENAAV